VRVGYLKMTCSGLTTDGGLCCIDLLKPRL
jgi:hypothetical protein